jgi:hypothetical protein
MKLCIDIGARCHGTRIQAVLGMVFAAAVTGCGGHEPTAAHPPVRAIADNEGRASVARDGARLRIRIKERKRIAPFVVKPAWEEVSYGREKPPAGRAGSSDMPAARMLPTTEATLDLGAPDTAIVQVAGSGNLDAGGSRFTLTANLSATVVQGSWYPLQRAANGYQFILSLSTSDGLRRLGTRESCMVTTLWNVPPQQCFHLLSMLNINAFHHSTGTEVDVGTACAYHGELNTKGTVSWQHNFNTDVSAREPRETQVFDTKHALITRKCFPDPSEFCIDQSLCESDDGGGDSWIGQSASVEGEVEWVSPFPSSGSTSEVVVCDVTDWYQLVGTQWVYLDTTVEACWVEPR